MKKKMALLVSILLFIGFFFFFVFYSEPVYEPETLEAGALSGEVRQGLRLQKVMSSALDTSRIRLCFQGQELACDQESATWYLPVDMDDARWEAGVFSDAGDEIRIFPLQDYTTLDKTAAVADGQAVPFLAWEESENAGAVIRVVFTGLPIVRIDTDADLDVDTVFAGGVTFYEACGQEDWTLYSAFQAHERGQTTRAYPKKGYRLNLISVTSTGVINENAQSVLGMRDSDSWIFYAIYSDGTKIRDKFNTELWNQFGAVNTPYDAHYGTHMEYVELVVNGEYRGLYGVMEPIDSSQLDISDQEYLYKRTFGRELTTEAMDAAEPEDYLTVLGMEIKGKDGAGTREDWQCLRRYVQMCEADDETFAKEAEDLLDMDNIADLWIYLQLLYGEDNIYKNMFFVFKREEGGYRLYLVPWDTDLTWGNVYKDSAEDLYVVSAPEMAGEYLEWPLVDRLLELNVGGLREKIAARWKELRSGVLAEDNMEELMEACIHEVQDSGAFARDAARWPDSRHDGDYVSMSEFMKKRLDFLDKWMQE